MNKVRTTWNIRQGDPTKIGARRTVDGYNFALELEDQETPLELLFYKKGENEPEQVIPVPDTYRTGNIAAVTVKYTGLHRYEYSWKQGDVFVEDPCAPVLYGTPPFGQKPKEGQVVRGGVLKEAAPKPLAKKIPYEDMVIYKVHVRGYTMEKHAGVRKRGTFRGLEEKLSYIQSLGMTSLELMPAYEFAEYPKLQKRPSKYLGPMEKESRLNFWGYTNGCYFAPKASFAAGNSPESELKSLISALHERGMECLMDFYFPDKIAPDRVLDILHFWKMEYQVDGFVLFGAGAWIELIARDALLGDTKILCPGFDEKRLCGEHGPAVRRLAEYHSGFQDAMRRFLKGDEGQMNGFFYHIKQNPATHGVIHYMANHDGFTLADLVSYDYRHNEENGEENRDGNANNYSWNCGEEGETRKKKIKALRLQQMKNALMLLFLSQGTPLIYGGDEFGNSQKGNNNAYCQDNEIGWVDWSKAKQNASLTAFVRELTALRKAHPILHMPYELRTADYKAYGWPEISFHSERAWFANTESTCRQAGILYCGAYAAKADGTPDNFLYVLYNMYWDKKTIALPILPEGMNWYPALDSAEMVEPERAEAVAADDKMREVGPRTIQVLVGCREKSLTDESISDQKTE